MPLATLTIGINSFTLPVSGTGIAIDVPTLAAGLTVDLNAMDQTYSGGTAINVAAEDTIAFSAGTFTGGVAFNVGAGTTVDLTGGQTVNYGGVLSGTGAGTVVLSSGAFYPTAGGVTPSFPGSMFQWTGGGMELSVGDVTNRGTINLSGPNEKEIYGDGTLFDYGSIVQTGTGNFTLHGDGVTLTTLSIEAGGSYLFESDAGIDIPEFTDETQIINDGTIEKTAGAGTTTLTVDGPLTNTGTIQVDSGTLNLEPLSMSELTGTTLTGGSWTAENGSTLDLPSGSAITVNAANVSLSGAGATILGLEQLNANDGILSLTNGASLSVAGSLTNAGTMTLGAGSTLSVSGDETETSAATLDIEIGGTPASQLFGSAVISGTTTLAGDFNATSVSGFKPSAGQDYQVLSFAGASGAFADVTGLPAGLTVSQTSTAFDLEVPQSSSDLLPTTVTAPATATDGTSIAVSWQVTNQGITAAGSWQDSVYLSSTSSITSRSILLGTETHTGGLGDGASYTASLSAALPAIAPGSYYVLVEIDCLYQVADLNRSNNTLAAESGLLDVSLPALTVGKGFSDSFTAADQDRYYQVTVPAGGAFSIGVSSAATSGADAVYVSQGSIPTPYDFEYEGAAPGQSSQLAVVPQVLAAGTYYIDAHSISGEAATAEFTVNVAQSSALAVSAISPSSGGEGYDVTMEIDGTNFSPSMTATLVQGSITIAASTIDYVSASRVFATFDLASVTLDGPPLNYTVNVEQGNQTVTAPRRFR